MSKQGLDKNSIIGLVLIGVILLIFSYVTQPSAEEIEAKKQQQLAKDKAKTEQIEKTQNAVISETNSAALTSTDSTQTDSLNVASNDSLKNLESFAVFGPFAKASEGEKEHFVIENDKMKITIANKGGRIASVELKEFVTYQNTPLILFNEDSSRFNIELTIPGITGGNSIRQINTEDLFFETDEKDFAVKGDETKTFTLKLFGNSTNEYLAYHYTIHGNSYLIDFDVESVGLKNVLSQHSNLFLNWSMFTPNLEKTIASQQHASTIYYKYNKGEVDYINEMKYEKENLVASIDWVMFRQQYFNATLIAKNQPFDKTDATIETIEIKEGKTPNYVEGMATNLTLPLVGEEKEKIELQFYFGPNKYDILTEYGIGLEETMNYGWGIFGWVNAILIRPVFNLLNSTGMHVGLIILLLTFIIKLVLFPITWKTYLSSAKMRVLKPQIDALKEKIGSDKMKLQQATMSLYRQTGVNPLAGCIPMLIQMPILFALFRFFPATFDLRQKSFLWAEDLSTYDSIYDLPFSIPFYGDHVSLFTLLMAISMIFYTKANSQMTAGTGMDGMMAQQMKIMMYLMPVMMLFFFNSYSAGLSYYYLIANVITIAQQWIIKEYIVDEQKVLAKLEMNKAKPLKKSGFAAKLEQKMKEAQALQAQNKGKKK
ncbi:MAG: membrane protein insertase YidC [Flavobacteriales bacterium]|nr:membrane protein insertase YidC [Flavobacteriales bacterium]MBV6484578.1 Membrane protein insertase YidC [Flavobacteriales bacterium]MBX2959342.1 membrane protein insertase YidC [Flavobacteriales bacterium]